MADPSHRDPGLAGERTDLSWTRSGLAVAVCVAVLLRHLWPLRTTDQLVVVACVSFGAVAWAATLVVRRATARSAPGHRTPLSARKAGVITSATLALAGAGLVLALFPPA